jgi:hypothetical protein
MDEWVIKIQIVFSLKIFASKNFMAAGSLKYPMGILL